jgi:hypothetical protein
MPWVSKHEVRQYSASRQAKPYNQHITGGFFPMSPESAVPFVAAAAGFSILLIVLAYAVQRE